MGILATIFGSGKVIEKGLDLIDDAFETDAEKRESKTNAKISLMKAYAPFKIAQRWLAVLFGVNFVLSFWVAVALWAAGRDMQGFLDIMTAFNLGWIMLTIVMFYFGGGLAESAGRMVKKGKSGA